MIEFSLAAILMLSVVAFFVGVINLCGMISEIWNSWFTLRAEKQRSWVYDMILRCEGSNMKDTFKNLDILQDISFNAHVNHLKTFKNPWVLYKDIKIRTDTKI